MHACMHTYTHIHAHPIKFDSEAPRSNNPLPATLYRFLETRMTEAFFFIINFTYMKGCGNKKQERKNERKK